MSSSLILELQRLAADKSHDVDDLLRKALIAAKKLRITDFQKWVESELNGYKSKDEVPEYRKVHAQIEAVNAVQGRLIPYYLPEDIAELFCIVPAAQPIGALTELAKSDSGRFTISLNPTEVQLLLEMQGSDFPMQPVRSVSRMEVVRIVNIVRNTILNWALELENEGILGEGLTFTEKEKAAAASSSNYYINNFQGVLGDVSQSEVTQHLHLTVKPGDTDSLAKYLVSKGIEQSDVEELKAAIRTDPKPTQPAKFGEQVSGWIGKMTTKAASGAWNVGIGAAGNLLANAIAAYYGSN